jgi:hypothetical protein
MYRAALFVVVSIVFLPTADCQQQGPVTTQGSGGSCNAGMTFKW